MSHWSVPEAIAVKAEGNGPSVTLSINIPQEECPLRIDAYLKEIGWQTNSWCPNTGEPLYSKNDEIHNEQGILENGTSGYYFRWHEAIAYEFYKMMTIGGMVGEHEAKEE